MSILAADGRITKVLTTTPLRPAQLPLLPLGTVVDWVRTLPGDSFRAQATRIATGFWELAGRHGRPGVKGPSDTWWNGETVTDAEFLMLLWKDDQLTR